MRLQNLISDKGKVDFCNELFERIEQFGLGSFSKADLDALLYHLIDINKDHRKIKDTYDWMRYLKVTPTKLRSLQLISSVKYLNLDDIDKNWKLLSKAIAKKNIEVEDVRKGTVRLFVDDTHVQRFIEKFVVDNGSSLDYQRNAGQVVLKYGIYLELVKRLTEKLQLDVGKILKELEKDTSHEDIKLVFDSPRHMLNQLKNKFKDKALDEAVKTTINLVTTQVIKFAKKKISGG